MEKKATQYFVCEKYPEDDFALELDIKQYTEEESIQLFNEKLSELPKLRLKLKDFLEYHFKKYSGSKIDFVNYLETIVDSKIGGDKVKEWVTNTRLELSKMDKALDFQKKVSFEEVPVKWANPSMDLSSWIAKMIKEGYFSVKDARSAEQFFEKLFN